MTIGGMVISNPIGAYLKRLVVKDKDIIEQLDEKDFRNIVNRLEGDNYDFIISRLKKEKFVPLMARLTDNEMSVIVNRMGSGDFRSVIGRLQEEDFVTIIERLIQDDLRLVISQLKEYDVINRFADIQSPHAITTVLAVQEGDEPVFAKLEHISARANQFFGELPESQALVGKNTFQLLGLLERYMDAKDYKAFHADQMSLLAGESSKTAVAKVPVIFNNSHTPAYKGRAFLPIVINMEVSAIAKQQGTKSRILIAYLDLEIFEGPVMMYAERRQERGAQSR